MINFLFLGILLTANPIEAKAADFIRLESQLSAPITEGYTNTMALSHSNQYAMAQYHLYDEEDDFVQFYDLKTNEMFRQIDNVYFSALSPINDDFVYWSAADHKVYRINLKTEATFPQLAGSGRPHFSPSAKYLALVSDQEISLLDGQTYEQKAKPVVIDQERLQWFQFNSTSELIGLVLESKQKKDVAYVLNSDLKTVWRLPVEELGSDYSQLFLHFLPNDHVLVVAANLCEFGNCPEAIAKAEIWDFKINKKIQDVDFGVEPIYLQSMTQWSQEFHVLWDAGLCILSTNEGKNDLLHFYSCENMQKLGQILVGGNLMRLSLSQASQKLVLNLHSLGEPTYINIYSFEESLVKAPSKD